MLTLFPDLTLAVEEGEPELAHDFFSTVKVREMKVMGMVYNNSYVLSVKHLDLEG